MFERLFENYPTVISSTNRQPRKIALVGAGQVGMSSAYSMLIQNTFDELVMVDVSRERLEGEVMDLVHGLPFAEPAIIRAGTTEDCAGADLVIITAGSAQRSGETRLDLLSRNVEIFRSFVPDLARYCPEAIFLVVSNPVDVLTYITWKLSCLPHTSVIGTGTVLDTARFRYLLGQKLQIDSRSIHAYIVGEHGDSEVPVWSGVNIAGKFLKSVDPKLGMPEDTEGFNEIFEQVKNAAYEIIKRKGATYYAIGMGVTQVVQSILRDQQRVLTVSSLVNGLYGINDVCLSLPSVVTRHGVNRVVQLDLDPTELEKLKQSAKILHEAISQLKI